MFFKDSIDELSYGEPRLQPLLFQDDINRVATSVLTAQKGNNQNESVVETMLLDFNLDKSCYIVMGNEKAKKSHNMDLEENPLIIFTEVGPSQGTIVQHRMNIVTSETYTLNWKFQNSFAMQ